MDSGSRRPASEDALEQQPRKQSKYARAKHFYCDLCKQSISFSSEKSLPFVMGGHKTQCQKRAAQNSWCPPGQSADDEDSALVGILHSMVESPYDGENIKSIMHTLPNWMKANVLGTSNLVNPLGTSITGVDNTCSTEDSISPDNVDRGSFSDRITTGETLEEDQCMSNRNRFQAAAEISKQTDDYIRSFQAVNHSNTEPISISNADLRTEAVEEFRALQMQFKLTSQCVKQIVGWMNKYIIPPNDEKFSLRRRRRKRNKVTVATTTISPPTVPTSTKMLCYGHGLSKGAEKGVSYELTYRDPISLVSRRVTEILHSYGGPKAFEIDERETGVFETAQQSRFLRSARNHFQDQDALIIPIKINADGAHLRANGLHMRDLVTCSVMHKYSFHDHVVPELICSINLPDKKMHKKAFDKLNPSLHHAVLDALFGALRTLYSNNNEMYIYYDGRPIRCYFVVYKLAMDMPMIATCSLTKTSRPVQQLYPCQQCLMPGQRREFFLAPANRHEIEYRREDQIARYIHDSDNFATALRLRYNLRHLARPTFTGMVPFDSRGIFLLAAADGLHAFKGMFFRGMINLGLHAFYLHSKMPSRDDQADDGDNYTDSPPDWTPNSQEDTIGMECASVSSGTASEFGDDEIEVDEDISENEYYQSADNTDNSDTEDEEDGRHDTWSVEAPHSEHSGLPQHTKIRFDHIESVHIQRRGRTKGTTEEEGDETNKPGEKVGVLSTGDIAERIGKILNSTKGRRLVQRGERIINSLSSRKGLDDIPIRRQNVLNQVTKMQEHKYSLGLLLQMMAIVGCDTGQPCMGLKVRELWVRVASKCILIYSCLYQRRPTNEHLDKAWTLIQSLLAEILELQKAIGYDWWPPKKHLLMHFPDMIKMFGRLRMWDTTEGENGISYIKRAYHTLSNNIIFRSFEAPLLQRMEQHSIERVIQSAMKIRSGLDRQSDELSITGNEKALHWCFNSTGRRKQPISFTVTIHGDGDALSIHAPKGWPANVFPLKCNEPRETFIDAIETSVSAYIGDIPETWNTPGVTMSADLYHHAVAKRLDLETNTHTTICASNSRYGKPRYDMVAYQVDETAIGYGELMAVAELRYLGVTHSVALLSPLDTSVHETSSGACPCKDFEGVFIHGRQSRRLNGSKVMLCIDLGRITKRLTVLPDCDSDTNCRPTAENSTCRVWPSGTWYFIVNPSIFEGVEQYS